jgi:hypothetical protein
MSDDESQITTALRSFGAAEANLEKLERLLSELAKLRPTGVAFGSDPKYDELLLAYSEVLGALPKIDGWKPVETPVDLNDLARWRFDAAEIDEPAAIIHVEEAIEAPDRELFLYRHRLNRNLSTRLRQRSLESYEGNAMVAAVSSSCRGVLALA